MGLLCGSKYKTSHNFLLYTQHTLKLWYFSIYMPHNLNRKQKTQKISLFMYERKRFDAFDKEKLQHSKAEIYSVTVLHIIF